MTRPITPRAPLRVAALARSAMLTKTGTGGASAAGVPFALSPTTARNLGSSKPPNAVSRADPAASVVSPRTP
jgi:hypothetical protein